ncbi:hypothetical protein AaE_013911, partial [Aphanomyces astaci]
MQLPKNVCVERTHNLPTVAQLVVIMEGDGSEPIEGRYVVLQSLNSNRFTTIRETNPLHDALQFPLLFPMGGSGWEYTMTKTDGKSFSLRAFFNYWLQERDGDDFSDMLHGSSMLCKMYTTVGFVRVETNRLRYISQKGDKLRFDLYASVKEATERCSGLHNVGIKSIVPSSFTGGKRYMKKCYFNTMAIVRKYGKPCLFVTMTCNPNWPEIISQLKPHQTSAERDDIVTCVFESKLTYFEDDIHKKHVLGKVVASVRVEEFQKRGLPHVHMLLIMEDQDKFRTVDDINSVVSARIPDEIKNPQLHESVKNFMTHTCTHVQYDDNGQPIPSARACTDKTGKCKKGFPQPLQATTTEGVDGYAEYRRDMAADQYCVPHNPYLVHKYNCHINVEVCTSIKAVKYMYKYVYKGSDRITYAVFTDRERQPMLDEAREYVEGRYVTSLEAITRIRCYDLQRMTHAVEVLPMHEKGQQHCTYDETHDAESRNQKTKLISFFLACAQGLTVIDGVPAKSCVYLDFPQYFRFHQKTKLKRPSCGLDARTTSRSLAALIRCIRTYATAKERLRRAEADGTSGGNLQIDLKAVGGAQARTHNLPTVAQLAVIMEGDGSEPTEGRHVVLQNQYCVPHNPYLVHKYNCHINVEVCTSINAVKYLYKYVHKGSDRFTYAVWERQPMLDEAREYVEGHYVSSLEAIPRIRCYDLQRMSHAVEVLPVHEKDQHHCTYDETHDAESLFARNQNIKVIGRIDSVSPRQKERFYIRTLLCHKYEPTSFEDLRTVHGTLYPTYEEAALSMGLLENDEEYVRTRELCLTKADFMDKRLRDLRRCNETLQETLSEDMMLGKAMFYTLKSIDCFQHHGMSLLDYPTLPQLHEFEVFRDLGEGQLLNDPRSRLYVNEASYTRAALDDVLATAATMTDEHRSFVATVLAQIYDHASGKAYFLQGEGGSGKSYVSWSAVGKTLLLMGCTTAHSRFKIPVTNLNEKSLCHIPKQSSLAKIIRDTKLIVWDEVSMIHKHALEAVDRSLRDIMDNPTALLGGKVVVFSGDFKQILPIIPRGTPLATVEASFRRSSIWNDEKIVKLTKNMRLRGGSDDA